MNITSVWNKKTYDGDWAPPQWAYHERGEGAPELYAGCIEGQSDLVLSCGAQRPIIYYFSRTWREVARLSKLCVLKKPIGNGARWVCIIIPQQIARFQVPGHLPFHHHPRQIASEALIDCGYWSHTDAVMLVVHIRGHAARGLDYRAPKPSTKRRVRGIAYMAWIVRGPRSASWTNGAPAGDARSFRVRSDTGRGRNLNTFQTATSSVRAGVAGEYGPWRNSPSPKMTE